MAEISEYVKLSTWAKSRGISYRTAWNWFKDGKLPGKAFQTETGTILVEISELQSKNINLKQ